MPESDLYPPVRDWLEARGWKLYVEKFDCDVVAVKDGLLLVVELKPCLSQDLVNQLWARKNWADRVYGAIPTNPNCTKEMQRLGFGLLIVKNGIAKQRCTARPQPWQRVKTRKYRFKALEKATPARRYDLAGLTSIEAGAQRRRNQERA